MITIESAESALKNIYLDVVINDINNKTNPFLTMIGKNTKTVAGKEIKCPIRYGDDGSVAAGHEDGDLPVSARSGYAEISVPLKNLYGTFQITDKAIRASQNSAGAFAALLSSEMKNLIAAARKNLNGMVYGNGTPFAAYTVKMNTAAKTFKVPSLFVNNLKAGDVFNLYTHNNVKVTDVNLTVGTFNKNTGDGTFLGTLASLPQIERFYIVKTNAEQNVDLNGIDSIFLPTNTIYNVDTNEHKGIKPFMLDVFPGGTEYMPVASEEDIINFLDGYEEHCQSSPADILLTHPGVRKALFENLKGTRSNIDVAEMAGGFKGFSFNGIPMYVDLKCKGGSLYALNSDSWSMNQLCDWTWLSGDDGSILRQIDGKAAYSATLVKYADLICEKPFLQGKVSGYAVKRWKDSQSAAEYLNKEEYYRG